MAAAAGGVAASASTASPKRIAASCFNWSELSAASRPRTLKRTQSPLRACSKLTLVRLRAEEGPRWDVRFES